MWVIVGRELGRESGRDKDKRKRSMGITYSMMCGVSMCAGGWGWMEKGGRGEEYGK